MENIRTAAGGLAGLGVEGWLAGAGAASLDAMWPYLAPSVAQVHHAAALVGQCGSLDTNWFEPLFGCDWPGHAFAHRPHFFGFRADEPHYTKMLAAFMTPSHVGASVAWKRARVFLGVLAEVGGLPLSLLPEPGQPVDVEPELSLGGGSLDLWFEWMVQDQPVAIAIEVKFKAGIHGDQLGLYKRCAKRTMNGKPIKRHWLLLVSRRQNAFINGWTEILWRGVLTRWENAIAAVADDDEDFARYRRALWETALQGGRHD